MTHLGFLHSPLMTLKINFVPFDHSKTEDQQGRRKGVDGVYLIIRFEESSQDTVYATQELVSQLAVGIQVYAKPMPNIMPTSLTMHSDTQIATFNH